jgi:hypothetical protein
VQFLVSSVVLQYDEVCCTNSGILDVQFKVQALEKAQAELGVLSEKYKLIKATILERKPQLQRVKEDMAKALETRVSLLPLDMELEHIEVVCRTRYRQ